jgi:hypothetical protein
VLAGFYRGAIKAQPSDAALRTTLDDMEPHVNALRASLERLPPRLCQLLDSVDLQFQYSSRSRFSLAEALKRFATCARYSARHRLRGRSGRKTAHLERVAAEWVRRLFAEHDLSFAPADDTRSRKKNPPSVCLRIVLGLADDAKVAHYFSPPRKR